MRAARLVDRVGTGLLLTGLMAVALVACGGSPELGRVPSRTSASPAEDSGSEQPSPSPTPSDDPSSPAPTRDAEPSGADGRVGQILDDFDAEDGAAGAVVSLDAAGLFDPDSAVLTAAGQDRLDELVELLVLLGDVPVTIRGHSDVAGGGEDAQVFAHQRAAAVAVHVVPEGVTSDQLTVEAFGPSEDQRIDVILPTVDLQELTPA